MDTVDVDGTGIAFLTDGPPDGPPVLVVHGFPDSPHSWAPLRTALADAGHRVVAPFQRGYAPSAVGADGRYQTAQLGRDLAGLVHALDLGPVDLVGHDWGATAVYAASRLLGERCRRVVGMSVPPGLGPQLFAYPQARRSFYIWLFQLPVDALVAADDLAFLDGLWDDWAMPGTDTVAAREAVKACLREPANLAAALGYYRAMFAPDPALADEQARALERPTQPLLYLHGERDGCIGPDASEHVQDRVLVPGANHFLQCDQPAAVAELVVGFLR